MKCTSRPTVIYYHANAGESDQVVERSTRPTPRRRKHGPPPPNRQGVLGEHGAQRDDAELSRVRPGADTWHLDECESRMRG